MKIVADENMPELELFHDAGRVVTVSGRDITPRTVADAEVLLVRSVTPVNAELLAGSDVRWVGSATIGTDHLDLPWLAQAGIKVVHAPGCNAMAVAEYVLQAALLWSEAHERPLAGLRLGLVGLGDVGRRVAALFDALEVQVLVSDPPREARGDLPEVGSWQPLEAILQCDLISIHVPLVRDGSWPTWHLLSSQALAQLGSGQCLINTSRGAVVDNAALAERLSGPQAPAAVLDVWEGEPLPDAGLVRAVGLGTPHVAGYSVEGKRRGTTMLWQQFCRWRGELSECPAVQAPAEAVALDVCQQADLLRLLQTRYRLNEDHQALLQAVASEQPGPAFDALRRVHGPRHECSGLRVTGQVGQRWEAALDALGVAYGRAVGAADAGNTQ